MTAQYVDTGHT